MPSPRQWTLVSKRRKNKGHRRHNEPTNLETETRLGRPKRGPGNASQPPDSLHGQHYQQHPTAETSHCNTASATSMGKRLNHWDSPLDPNFVPTKLLKNPQRKLEARAPLMAADSTRRELGAADDKVEWSQWRKDRNMTPPAIVGQRPPAIEHQGQNTLNLARSGLKWGDLTQNEQGMLGYLLNEKIDEVLTSREGHTPESAAVKMVAAVTHSGSREHQALKCYTRKGGDKMIDVVQRVEHNPLEPFHDFCRSKPEWSAAEAGADTVCLYNLYPQLKIIRRIQRLGSHICVFVTLTNLLDLVQQVRIQKKASRGAHHGQLAVSMGRFALIVGRWLRTETTAQEKCDNIFNNRGFVVIKVLTTLLRKNNDPEAEFIHFTQSFALNPEDVDGTYNVVESFLRQGPLFMLTFRVPNLYEDNAELPSPLQFDQNVPQHTSIVVGARKANGTIIFLFQDSSPGWLFREITLEQMLEMQVYDLYSIRPMTRLPEKEHISQLSQPEAVRSTITGCLTPPEPGAVKPPSQDHLVLERQIQEHYLSGPDHVPGWAVLEGDGATQPLSYSDSFED